jgi:hypothetical protein
MPVLWLFGVLMLVVGCGSEQRREQAFASTEPAAAFSALEDRLLNASLVRFDFHVTAEGAFEADLRGALHIDDVERVQVTASGQFGGQPVELFLRSEGEEVEFGNGPNRTSGARPRNLNEALLMGLTRMGILHNLARLVSGRAPDHADGAVSEWAGVSSFAAVVGDSDALSFDITVAGEPAGSAVLEFDSRGRPTGRRQTVQFPSGEMRVVERYSAVAIDP